MPLVVAEFNQVRGGGWTIDGMYPYLYGHGYAGRGPGMQMRMVRTLTHSLLKKRV